LVSHLTNVKKAQDIVDELQRQMSKAREMLKPQKKFSFRARKKEDEKTDVKVKEVSTPRTANVTSLIEPTRSNLSDSVVCIAESEANGKDLLFVNITRCSIKIEGVPSSLFLKNVEDSLIISLPVSTSVFVEDCTKCTFVVACQQLRVHGTQNCKFYLHVTSRGIIENCKQIYFAPYNLTITEKEQRKSLEMIFDYAKLDFKRNNWQQIDDFDWLATGTPSPNWSLLPEDSLESFQI